MPGPGRGFPCVTWYCGHVQVRVLSGRAGCFSTCLKVVTARVHTAESRRFPRGATPCPEAAVLGLEAEAGLGLDESRACGSSVRCWEGCFCVRGSVNVKQHTFLIKRLGPAEGGSQEAFFHLSRSSSEGAASQKRPWGLVGKCCSFWGEPAWGLRLRSLGTGFHMKAGGLCGPPGNAIQRQGSNRAARPCSSTTEAAPLASRICAGP